MYCPSIAPGYGYYHKISALIKMSVYGAWACNDDIKKNTLVIMSLFCQSSDLVQFVIS